MSEMTENREIIIEEENIVWNVPEVAKYLNCNVSSIRKLVRNGKIPVWRIRK